MSEQREIKPWQVLERRSIVADRWLCLDSDRVQTADGTIFDCFYRIREPEWACIVPQLADGRLVMVEQYRHGIGGSSLEFPAGDLDPGEQAHQAASRELQEEAGYQVIGQPQPLGVLATEPSRSNNRGYGFWARVKAHPQGPSMEQGEHCICRLLTVKECFEAIESGLFSHAAHVAFVLQAQAQGLLSA